AFCCWIFASDLGTKQSCSLTHSGTHNFRKLTIIKACVNLISIPYGIFDSRMAVITGRRQFIAFVMDLPLSRELIRQIPLSATEYL
ncbi:MAG: hypothetical protein WCF03_00850, partial [Nitrososphaeraceae archaeon]